MSLYSQTLLINVNRVLTQHGYDVTFSRDNVGGTYSPSTATIEGGTSPSETAFGVFISRSTAFQLTEILVEESRVFLMKASGLSKVPTVGDDLTKDGVPVKIGSVKSVQSGSTVVLYVCGIEG